MEPAPHRSSLDVQTILLAVVTLVLIAMSFVLPATIFNQGRRSAFILFVLFSAFLLHAIRRARAGAPLYLRPIAGLKAIDEAIGRATEMGKKILYIPGILSMDEIQTIASMAVLGHVSRQTAAYSADLDVPNMDALTYTAARETVRQSYLESGRPDAWRESIVTYVTADQWAYTAAITGRMVRERPAAHFFIGSFYAESMVLAEVGQSVGAIQVAATAEVAQLPFFVCACDYVLIGEEFYAASAYLSKEPMLLGSVKGQDWVKLIVIGWLVAGFALLAGGNHWLVTLLESK